MSDRVEVPKSSRRWPGLAALSLVLGLCLWFLSFTDYSLVGTLPDLIFPPAVALVAVISLVISWRRTRRRGRLLVALAHLPALSGGLLFLLAGIMLFVPPFTLGGLFAAGEIAGETRIQQNASPNNHLVASVYFRGVGAYGGGNGRIYVRVQHRTLPFLERDVFYLGESLATEKSSDYVKWVDNGTIHVSEVDQDVDVIGVRAEVPDFLALPFYLTRMLIVAAQEAAENRELTAPVRDVPFYPGGLDDQARYDETKATVFRSFNSDDDVEQVVRWHQEALNKAPWRLVAVNSHTVVEYGSTRIKFCIETTRVFDQQTRTYYWEFMGDSVTGHVTHVNIGTPKPITDACARYASTSLDAWSTP